MDDIPCRRFFLEPVQPLHRRYAALRTFFVENLPLPTIADRFGVTYHTVRSWVRDFRAQCQAGQIPPFSLSRVWADRLAPTSPESRRAPKNQPLPMAAN